MRRVGSHHGCVWHYVNNAWLVLLACAAMMSTLNMKEGRLALLKSLHTGRGKQRHLWRLTALAAPSVTSGNLSAVFKFI